MILVQQAQVVVREGSRSSAQQAQHMWNTINLRLDQLRLGLIRASIMASDFWKVVLF